MRSVRLLAIEHPQVSSSDYDVRVLVEVDGRHAWHQLTVRPQVIAGFDASLIAASDELQSLFQDQQSTIHRICKLVGDELRGRQVRMPQQIAA